MQETYLTVWTKAGSYVPQGKPLAWVFTIARNLCYMRFREQKMKSDVALEDLAEKEEGAYCAPLEQAADRKVLLDALGRISRGHMAFLAVFIQLLQHLIQFSLLHARTVILHRDADPLPILFSRNPYGAV